VDVCVWERERKRERVGKCGYMSSGMCLLTYPVCHAQASHFLRLLWLHNIFRHYFINETIFVKQSLNIKCVFWFHLQLLFKKFLIVRIIQRDTVINVKILHVKYPLFLSDFNQIWIFCTEFRKSLKYQISSKSVQWEPTCSMRTVRRTGRRTYEHDEANSRFLQFLERA
jgi:hypothetical protein